MSKTLNQGTGRACACQGKTLGEVFATQDADKIRAEVSRRYEQEAVALTVRLERAEDEVERLKGECKGIEDGFSSFLTELTVLLLGDEAAPMGTIRTLNEVERLAGNVEHLTKELDKQKSWTAANVDKVKAENARLLASLHEEQRQRRVIAEMLDVPPDSGLDETTTAIRRLQALLDQPSLDIVAREKPEDLPIGYAFKVAAYVLDRAAELEE